MDRCDIIKLEGNDSFEVNTLNSSIYEDNNNNEIKEYFKCFICFEKVKDPLMCPECSKFACKICFTKWIEETKEECPNCRNYLDNDKLVKVNILNDIYRSIKTLVTNSNYNEKETCSEHQKCELLYYCNDCNKPICSDCAILSPDHKSHKIDKIEGIINQQLEIIKIEMKNLSNKIEDIKVNINNLQFKEENIREIKNLRIRELEDFVKEIKNKTEHELVNNLEKITEFKNIFKQEKYLYESQFINISRNIKKNIKNNKMLRTSEIVDHLQKLNSKSILEYENELDPNYEIDNYFEAIEGEFTLTNYTTLKDKGELIFSQEVEMDGNKWRLKIYPNGTGMYMGNYLSVFIEMVYGFEEGSYSYKVMMLKCDNSHKYLEKEFISEFSSTVSWGYNRFFKIENLEKENYLNEFKDEIKFKFIIRPANFYQKIKDLKNYNKFILNKLNEKNNFDNPKLEEEPIENFSNNEFGTEEENNSIENVPENNVTNNINDME